MYRTFYPRTPVPTHWKDHGYEDVVDEAHKLVERLQSAVLALTTSVSQSGNPTSSNPSTDVHRPIDNSLHDIMDKYAVDLHASAENHAHSPEQPR